MLAENKGISILRRIELEDNKYAVEISINDGIPFGVRYYPHDRRSQGFTTIDRLLNMYAQKLADLSGENFELLLRQLTRKLDRGESIPYPSL